MLEELALPYELRMLPFPPRVLAREYLSVNPLGTVPALRVGDHLMTESAAMCEYLASLAGAQRLGITPADTRYPAYLNWIHYGETTLTVPQTLVLRYGRFEPQERRLASITEDYGRWFIARSRLLTPTVAAQPYLCGKVFTAADISVGYALLLANYTGLMDRLDDSIRAYFARLSRREAYQRARLEEQRQAAIQGIDRTPAPDTV
jgi:glutathione S-transferase